LAWGRCSAQRRLPAGCRSRQHKCCGPCRAASCPAMQLPRGCLAAHCDHRQASRWGAAGQQAPPCGSHRRRTFMLAPAPTSPRKNDFLPMTSSGPAAASNSALSPTARVEGGGRGRCVGGAAAPTSTTAPGAVGNASPAGEGAVWARAASPGAPRSARPRTRREEDQGALLRRALAARHRRLQKQASRGAHGFRNALGGGCIHGADIHVALACADACGRPAAAHAVGFDGRVAAWAWPPACCCLHARCVAVAAATRPVWPVCCTASQPPARTLTGRGPFRARGNFQGCSGV